MSLLALVFTPTVAAAEMNRDDAAQNAAPKAFRLEEITVTSTHPAETVSERTVPRQDIDRPTIEATTALSVEHVLEEIPDLYVRRNETFRLGASTVRLQGADPNKVAILIDGKRLLGGVDGVVDVRDIPVELIERVEVQRGIAGSFVDSEAMAGSVNIVTRTPEERPSWSAKLAGGSFDRLLGAFSLAGRHRSFSYLLAYEHDEFALAQQFGAISRQFEGSNSDAKQVRDNVFLRANWQHPSASTLSGTLHFLPVREGPESRRTNLSTDLGWTYRFVQAGELAVLGGRYGFDRENSLPGFQEDVDFEQWFFEADFSSNPILVLDSSNTFSFGYRARRPRLEQHALPGVATSSQLVSIPHGGGTATVQSPYIEHEWNNLGALSLADGVNFDLHSLFPVQVTPRLVITWRPSDRFRLSAAGGRGYRAPDLLQLYDVDLNNVVAIGDRPTGYAILGNRSLRPEFDYAFNLEAEWIPLRGMRLEANAFRHDFRNLIDVVLLCASSTQCVGGFQHPFPSLAGQVFQYANVARAETAGVDLSVKCSLAELSGWAPRRLQPTLGLAYGFLHSRNASERPGEMGKELPFRPPHRFIPSLLLVAPEQAVQAKLWAEYEDRTFTDLLNTPDQIARSHWTVNTRLQVGLQPWVRRYLPSTSAQWLSGTALFIEATNLLDVEYGVAGPLSRLAGRRSVLFGVHTRS
ncbi:MAG: TonB-dependent receptor [Candidatus Binatia bacterium]|nr:TonB-dependent receptor [Candidatus Binatia bacterium]